MLRTEKYQSKVRAIKNPIQSKEDNKIIGNQGKKSAITSQHNKTRRNKHQAEKNQVIETQICT